MKSNKSEWKEVPVHTITNGCRDLPKLFINLLAILNESGYKIIVEQSEEIWDGLPKGKQYRLKEKK